MNKRVMLMVLVAIVALTASVVSPADAQPTPCAQLGGTIVAGECQVAAPFTVSVPAVTLPQTLHVLPTGLITVPAGGSLSVSITGNLVVDSGGQIRADSVLPSDAAGSIALTATTGDIRLFTTAAITADSTFGSCLPGGRAGTVSLQARGNITIDNLATLSTSGQCVAGSLSVKSTNGNVTVAGLLLSQSGLQPLSTDPNTRGGPITVVAANNMTLTETGRLSSAGNRPGADLVHVEGGGNVTIRGLVESTGGVMPTTPANGCAGTNRPEKPASSTACVEVWAGGTLTVDGSVGLHGEINADTARFSTGTTGACCAWIDLFALGDVTITGPATDQNILPYAVHAVQFANTGGFGGAVTVKAVRGKLSMNGLAIQSSDNFGPINMAQCIAFQTANPGRVCGGTGGVISLEAAGSTFPSPVPPGTAGTPDPGSNIELKASIIRAQGHGLGKGGQLTVRSYSGNVLGGDCSNGGTQGSSDANGNRPGVPGTGAAQSGTCAGAISLTGGTAGSATLQSNVCGLIQYDGVTTPLPTLQFPQCGGTPTLPAFAVITPYTPEPTVTVVGGSFTFQAGVGHGATLATVTGINGEDLGAPTLTYTTAAGGAITNPDANGRPIDIGDYIVTATFAGTAEYKAASSTATISIRTLVLGAEIALTLPGTPTAGSTPANPTSQSVYTRLPQPGTALLRDATTKAPIAGAVTLTYTPGGDTAPANVGTYQVKATFAGSTNPDYSAAEATGTIIITKATPTITLTGGGTFTYDTVTHGVEGQVTGVTLNGMPEDLGQPQILYAGGSTVPLDAGTYPVVATYAGNGNYIGATATSQVVITKAAVTADIIGGTFTYDGFSHPATAANGVSQPWIYGVGTERFTGVLTYAPGGTAEPVSPGTYTATFSFASDDNHLALTPPVTVTITIVGLTPTITLTTSPGTFNNQPHAATATVTDIEGAPLTPAATIFYFAAGATPACPPVGGTATAPTNVADYLAVALYPGNNAVGYASGCQSAAFSITQATPTLTATGGAFVYDGLTHAAAVVLSSGIAGVNLGAPTVTYNGGAALPLNAGTYAVAASFAGTTNFASASAAATIVIAPATPVVTVTSATVSYDGQPHAVTATVTGPGIPSGTQPTTVTYNGSATPPTAIGVYAVVATYTPASANYATAVGNGTLTIDEAPAEACFVVDFREITYFKDNRVFMSSDAAIRAQNGIAGGFNPAAWPYSASGGSNRTKSRGTLFRIYGFKAEELGFGIPDVDVPGRFYPVVADTQLPGMHYIELNEPGGPAGGHRGRVYVCPSQLQTSLIDQGKKSLDDPGVLPGTTVLPDDKKNVPGILLTHNASLLSIPQRVRTELNGLGMPLVDARGRPLTKGVVDYIGMQLWGGGGSSYHEFVDVELTFVEDSRTDRVKHYTFGFHTAKDINYEGRSFGCDYVDSIVGRDTIRLNDVWEGTRVNDPNWGPACGSREPSANEKKRENYRLGFNAVQLLPTVNTGNDTARLYYGTIRPLENRAPSCSVATGPGNLWPPNHKFVEIDIDNVTDPEGNRVTIKITGIFQDEPTLQPGSGSTAVDGKGIGTSTAQVRAERSGTGDGRLYEITFQATDSDGTSCTGSVFAGVPHDQGQHNLPTDTGLRYNSTVPGVPQVH